MKSQPLLLLLPSRIPPQASCLIPASVGIPGDVHDKGDKYISFHGRDWHISATTDSTLTLTVSCQEHSSSKTGHIRPVWSKASTLTVACPMATSSPPTRIISYLPLHQYYPALHHASAVLSLRRGNHQQLVPITSASSGA